MAVYHCGACGAVLEIRPYDKVATCKYCGVTQTLTEENDGNRTQVKVDHSEEISAWMRRVFLLLEDQNWYNAGLYCEKILDREPENAYAYLGKLMAELQVRKREDLAHCSQPFDTYANYNKIMRFADPVLKEEISRYAKLCRARWQAALQQKTEKERREQKEKQSAEEQAREYLAAQQAEVQRKMAGVVAVLCVLFIFVMVGKGLVKVQREKEYQNELRQQEEKYVDAVNKFNSGDYLQAYTLFQNMKNYKDSGDYVLRSQYHYGKKLLDEDEYEDAYQIFLGLEDYQDSEELAQVAGYRTANKLLDSHDLQGAYDIYVTMMDYADSSDKIDDIEWQWTEQSLRNAEEGDSIFLGTYRQENSSDMVVEKVEWVVLERKGENILLLSKDALDYLSYDDHGNGEDGVVVWETCTLRKYLNGEMYEELFGAKAKAHILMTGNDKLFLLSRDEMKHYFPLADDRVTHLTDYSYHKMIDAGWPPTMGGVTGWWLREPIMESFGYIVAIGNSGDDAWKRADSTSGVRPAVWIGIP